MRMNRHNVIPDAVGRQFHPMIRSNGRAAAILVRHGPLAQLVEHRTFNPLVAGSNPAGPTQKPAGDNLSKVTSLAGFVVPLRSEYAAESIAAATS